MTTDNKTLKQSFGSIKKGAYILPNCLTLTALFLGFFSIISATKQDFEFSAIAIFIAMVFDGLDGRVARLINAQSSFGAELDSLSDMICFGLAPALLSFNWMFMGYGKLGWLAAFIFIAATALRLARFNTLNDSGNKRYFSGLSSPMAAGVVASFIWLALKYDFADLIQEWMMVVVMILLACLMISSIPYRSFKDLNLSRRVSYQRVFIIIVAIVLIVWHPTILLFSIFTLYALSGLVIYLQRLLFRRLPKVISRRGK